MYNLNLTLHREREGLALSLFPYFGPSDFPTLFAILFVSLNGASSPSGFYTKRYLLWTSVSA
ncbi:hypothetical protein Mapa_009662 [Marchantia paleacea]|nr:hypothetical protein Mapa_009662 [Marchantia paleacea]